MGKIVTIIIMFSALFGCMSSKKKDKAFDVFNEGVSLSLDATNQGDAGNFQKAEALNREAIKKFNETLAIDPNYLGAISALGHSHYMVKEFKEGISWFEKALALDSTSSATHLEHGLCKVNLGDVEGGKASIEQAISLDRSEETKNLAVYRLLDIGTLAFDYGNGYVEEGDPEKGLNYKKFAVNVLYAAHQIDSTQQDVIKNMVAFSQEIGETELTESFKKKLE